MASLRVMLLLPILCLASVGLTISATPNKLGGAELKSLHVISDIKYRFATTLVSMIYYNPNNYSVTADLHVNMPRNSFLSNFSMEVDGNVTVGKVEEKSLAKDIFQHAINTGQSAGYIEVKHRFTNVFDISVNVEPDKYVVYNLTYQELLTRQGGKYRHIIHLSNGEIIDDFLVEVFITDFQDIIGLHVPKIRDDKLTDATDDGVLDSALIEHLSSHEVYIKYNPSAKQQREITNSDGVSGLLRVEYDVERKNNSNMIYAVAGYFVHWFAPDSLPTLPKHIIFMLDVSGSMTGRKIEQLKQAMENILDRLDPELDKFLIGTFSSEVSWMQKNFLPATNLNKKLGKTFTQKLVASGGTNINAALLESIEKHKTWLSPSKKSIIIFLTDGQATSGVSNPYDIKKNVKESNKNISLFALGFGDNSDNKFLREISSENGGFSRKIYVDSDSRLQIENLYKEISNILLKDISIVYLNGVGNTSTTTFSSYFKGSEIVVSGVLAHQNQSTMNVNLIMTNQWGLDEEFLELEIYGRNITVNPHLTTLQSLSEITEKTYAYLTLQQLLREDRTTEVEKHVLYLALKYNFVTPLTSMVVTKSRVQEHFFDEDDLPDVHPKMRGFNAGKIGLVALVKTPQQKFPAALFYTRPSFTASRYFHTTTVPPRPTSTKKSPRTTYRKKPTRPTYTTTPTRPTYTTTPSRPTYTTTPSRSTYTTTPSRPTYTTRPTRPTYTTTPTRHALPNIPGIFLQPFSCNHSLCLAHHVSCSASTRILLLANFQANLFIHAMVKQTSQNNCLNTINRVILKKKRRLLFEITADRIIKKGKEIDMSNRTEYNLNVKNILSLKVIKTMRPGFPEPFLSLHFTALKKVTRVRGIFKKYLAKSSCPHPTKDTVHKIKGITSNFGIRQCYLTS
ncbi:inter-alpha-trypsin inhibitor heavy chain H4-like [Argonauta hians]